MIRSQTMFVEEVVRLHRVFEEWFAGHPGASLTGFADALGDDFEIVSPDGVALDKKQILYAVASAGGTGAVDITISAPRLMIDGEVMVGQYEEHQTRDGTTSSRVSTAVLSRDPGAPGGFVWHLVHETWLPGSGPRQA